MGTTTQIEWADATLNTAWGCTHVSPGCANCYMYRLSRRYGHDPDVPKARTTERIVDCIRKLGPEHRVVFLNSMSDTFHDAYSDELITEWLGLLFTRAPQHRFLLLTKRSSRMAEYFAGRTVAPNVWLGVSVETPAQFGRIQELESIEMPDKWSRRFVSFEPLLASVKDAPIDRLDWVIVGGESDFRAPRPMDPDWAREVRDACRARRIPFFLKQLGGKRKINGAWGGNVLDGRRHLEMPDALRLRTKESTSATQTTLAPVPKQATLEGSA